MKKYNLKKHKIFSCYTLITTILFLLPIISCTSLNNMPVDVYVGGEAYIGNANVPVAVYWKNGELVPLSTKYWKDDEKPPSTRSSCVNDIFVYGNDVYAGGYYKRIYRTENPESIDMDDYEEREVWVACYWKNGKLISLSNSKYGSNVDSIFVSGNDVYVDGSIRTKDRIITGYWKNGKWNDHALIISNNNLYTVDHDGYWKNGELIKFPVLEEKSSSITYSTFISGNDVYSCGFYNKNNDFDMDMACYWKNGKIIPLSALDPAKYSSFATSIFVSGNDVYIVGLLAERYYQSIRSQTACYWKNGKMRELKPIDKNRDSWADSIFVYGKDVYISGLCESRDGKIQGYWKNGTWVGFKEKGERGSSIFVVPRPTEQ